VLDRVPKGPLQWSLWTAGRGMSYKSTPPCTGYRVFVPKNNYDLPEVAPSSLSVATIAAASAMIIGSAWP
jgi:hypothetical protein